MNSMFVYHLVDPDLRVEILFEKNTQQEIGDTDFEIAQII